jgi:hypothetical protein
VIEHTPELDRVFLDVIAEHTAGDPQKGLRWTNLRPREIAQRISEPAFL